MLVWLINSLFCLEIVRKYLKCLTKATYSKVAFANFLFWLTSSDKTPNVLIEQDIKLRKAANSDILEAECSSYSSQTSKTINQLSANSSELVPKLFFS